MSVTIVQILLLLFGISSIQTSDFLGGREVRLERVKQNWMAAFETCRTYGLQLLTLRSSEENTELAELLGHHNVTAVWLAATDIAQEGTFVWATTGRKVTNAKWSDRNPDNSQGKENCVRFGGLWNDIVCNAKLFFFCEEITRDVKFAGNCKLDDEKTLAECIFRSTSDFDEEVLPPE